MLLLLLGSMLAVDPEPAPRAITVQLTRPRQLGESLLALFEGAKAPSPAAALAGYRRARGGNSGLTKAAEAAIAAINPGMVAELDVLRDASFHLDRSADGRPIWDLVIPRDDGTFEAIGTAMVLTDGASQPPINGCPVDRLGPPGAPLMTRGPEGLVIASDRQSLADGVKRPGPPRLSFGDWVQGKDFDRNLPSIRIRLDPSRLAATGNDLVSRRIGEALPGLGADRADLRLQLRGDALSLQFDAHKPGPPRPFVPSQVIQWIRPLTVEGAFVIFGIAIDPDPATRDAAFALLDRVEKADPARAGVAPIRLRLALLARASGVNLEADIWPHLVGISGVATSDLRGRPDGGSLRLHFNDVDAAERVRAVVVPRLLTAIGGKPGADGVFAVGPTVVDARREDSSVIVTAGPPGRPPAANDPEIVRQAVHLLDDTGMQPTMVNFTVVWPARLQAMGMPDVPPIIVVGSDNGRATIYCDGLKRLVKRLLDRLPYDPPSDVSTPAPRR